MAELSINHVHEVDFVLIIGPRSRHTVLARLMKSAPFCVGCSVHYWVSCAVNNGGFFEIAFVVVVDTHLPPFEALAYVLPHFDELTHVVIRASSSVC